ncbi:MAG: hypothetical protein ABIO70_23570 [Pseudomonadota bacterium]
MARREALAAAAVILLGPWVLAWPLPLVFRRELLGWRLQEAAVHAWGLWAAWREHSPLVVDTRLVNWPAGARYVLVDPLNLGPWGLGAWLGPAAGYNMVLLCGLLVAGLGGALLARRIGGAPWLGALAAMACPTLLAGTFEGQTESFAVGWVALQLALLLDFADRGGRRRGALALLAIAATGYAGPYNAVWAGFVDLGVLGMLAARRRWPQLGRAAGVVVVAALACLPLAWALLTARAPEMSGSGARAALPELWEDPVMWRGFLHHGADLLDPWLPLQLTGGRPEMSHTAYLGLAALILGVLAWARDRRRWPWLLGALGFALLALGPWLYVQGRAPRLGGHAVLLPAGWLTALVPAVLGRLRRWERAAAVATLLLAPLVSTWGRGARARLLGPVAALLIVGDLVLCAPMAWPLLHAAPPDMTPLAGLEGVGAILELPRATPEAALGGHAWRDQAALAQIGHGHPTASTSTLFAGVFGSPTSRTAVLTLRGSATLTSNQRRALAREGFTHLLVHLPFFEEPERSLAAFVPCLGEPVALGPDVAVFDLRRDAGHCPPADARMLLPGR